VAVGIREWRGRSGGGLRRRPRVSRRRGSSLARTKGRGGNQRRGCGVSEPNSDCRHSWTFQADPVPLKINFTHEYFTTAGSGPWDGGRESRDPYTRKRLGGRVCNSSLRSSFFRVSRCGRRADARSPRGVRRDFFAFLAHTQRIAVPNRVLDSSSLGFSIEGAYLVELKLF